MDTNFSKYLHKAEEFIKNLKQVKDKINLTKGWYPYPIMSNIFAIDQLLTGENRNFFSTITSNSLFLDIGSADGDLAFFWEKMGFNMHILDFAQTNYNDLEGARTLKKALHSNATIIESNIDDQFKLESEYKVVFALGLLYHLKNPIYFLQKLACHAEYLFLSTRVTCFLPDGKTNVKDIAVAYLLSPRECNNDPTNYWIFSHEGLKRVLKRSGWQILDFTTFGSKGNSTPQDNDRDERAFIFAKRIDNIHEMMKHHDV